MRDFTLRMDFTMRITQSESDAKNQALQMKATTREKKTGTSLVSLVFILIVSFCCHKNPKWTDANWGASWHIYCDTLIELYAGILLCTVIAISVNSRRNHDIASSEKCDGIAWTNLFCPQSFKWKQFAINIHTGIASHVCTKVREEHKRAIEIYWNIFYDFFFPLSISLNNVKWNETSNFM